MARINNLNEFKTNTSKITSFSHAYLFSVNSLNVAFTYVKEFAKQIICENIKDEGEIEDISYKIDNNCFDDLYIVNPSTIGINTEEINKLLIYMETKSIRENGRRVYIIYGFERLSRDVSNKILKFLEEPSENIYALLMTENLEKILPTIVSRCHILNYTFPVEECNLEDIRVLNSFIDDLILKKEKMIAYEFDYFRDLLQDRMKFYNAFQILENIVSNTLNKKYGCEYNESYVNVSLFEYSKDEIVKVLDITNQLKCLINGNINLNLLIDRYIIEVTEVLGLCKK